MAELIRIALVKDEWTQLFKKLSSGQVAKTLDKVSYKTADNIATQLRAASGQWKSISENINIKKGKGNTQITMPLKGIYLDSMEPHYVSLKRGRNITAWVKRNSHVTARGNRRFNKHKSNRSYILSGPRGGIRGGGVYVTPTPWIDAPMQRGMKNIPKYIKHEVRQLLKKGG